MGLIRKIVFAGAMVAAIVACVALNGHPLFAQTFTGTISGSIKDASGAVLPGVDITIRNTESGLTRMIISGETGTYNVQALPVGPYEITADLVGFKQQVRSGINLAVSQEAVVNLTLEVGGGSEQIQVSAEAPLVNTTVSSTSGLITETQVKDLPLNGRSFDQLLTLNTGISNNSSNIKGWTGFSVAGKRPESNRYLINGVDWVGSNASGQFITPSGASGQLLGVEAIREYNVLGHTYGAEYGKRAGAQISVVTSSGANQWHGDVFEYIRNSALDAKNFFDDAKSPIPPFKRNQFGGAVGGPIKKDKVFIFGTYEGFQQRLGQTSRAVVPDAQARQGSLPCNLITPAPSPCPDSGYALVPNLKQGMLPYANSFWPSPNGPEVLVNGLASGTAYNYSSASQSVGESFALVRVDTNWSKDSLSANYNIDDGERKAPMLNANFAERAPIRSQTFSMQETRVISPTIVNAATLGFARTHTIQNQGPVVPISADLVFVPGGNPGSITIGGGSALAAAAIVPATVDNPTFSIREYYTAADDIHFTKGKHSFSAGVWLQRIHNNIYGGQPSAGAVAYNSLLSFLQDSPSSFMVRRHLTLVGYRSTEAAWYFQDEFKVRPNLSIRVGLRDEMTNGWNEVAGRCASYPFENSVISTNPVINSSCLGRNNAKALLQPRVGLAWDPTGTGKWAVRAGFGIHNDLIDNLGAKTYGNPPFNASEALTGSLLSLVPIDKNAALPPTCGPGVPQPCALYRPAGVDPNLFTPTIQQWSVTLQRALAGNLMLQVEYVGSESYHLPLAVNGNTPSPQVCADSQGCESGGTTTAGAIVAVAQRGRVPQGAIYLPPSTRPNPYVASSNTQFNQGTSNYNAVSLSLTQRLSHGLNFKTNYTYGKVIDLNSGLLALSAQNEPANTFAGPYLLGLNRGVASFSLNHQFNGNFSYQLPFGNGKQFGGGATGVLNQLIGDWQWNGIVQAQGGFPFTPVVGSNISGTGDTNAPDVPNWNPNFNGKVILGKPDQWFDPHAFVLPTAGTFGNLSRGALRGPRLITVDTSLFKSFKVNETWSMQFRAEAFNILNHPNFATPSPVVFSGGAYSSSAGVVPFTSTTSRQLQFALKLLF